MTVMHERLNTLLSHVTECQKTSQVHSSPPKPVAVTTSEEPLPPGWCLLGEKSHWRPCPIGVFISADLGDKGII